MNSLISKLSKFKIHQKNIISNKDVEILLETLRAILFLGCSEKIDINVEEYINDKIFKIQNLLHILLIDYDNKDILIKNFICSIIEVKMKLNVDIKAFLAFDPSVKSETEVILCYPGFYAITTYRIAHELDKLNIELLPRILSEYAHSKTGIDIHPKANIDAGFFIDHGTGVVIGETCTIGKNVKIYHGVTLGAIRLKEASELKNKKRHPTIEDNVCIYSNATILGGGTVIGENSVIGCNTFITSSIKPNSKIIFSNYNQIQK